LSLDNPRNIALLRGLTLCDGGREDSAQSAGFDGCAVVRLCTDNARPAEPALSKAGRRASNSAAALLAGCRSPPALFWDEAANMAV
jgi:hypothetical protein